MSRPRSYENSENWYKNYLRKTKICSGQPKGEATSLSGPQQRGPNPPNQGPGNERAVYPRTLTIGVNKETGREQVREDKNHTNNNRAHTTNNNTHTTNNNSHNTNGNPASHNINHGKGTYNKHQTHSDSNHHTTNGFNRITVSNH
jgi:hypothetical protein